MSRSAIFSAAVDQWRELNTEWRDVIEAQFVAAEEATRGNLLNARGRERQVDAFSLFYGPDVRARAYASEELIAFWSTTPRVTFADYEAAAGVRHVCQHCGEAASA